MNIKEFLKFVLLPLLCYILYAVIINHLYNIGALS